jgi:hypothetical protein
MEHKYLPFQFAEMPVEQTYEQAAQKGHRSEKARKGLVKSLFGS